MNRSEVDEEIVLIVDDDDAARDSLKMLLEVQGFRAEAYENCRDFLDSQRMHSGACLVLDVHLPGMSGFDLMEELAAREVVLPIILVTGRYDRSIRDRANAMGALALLEKLIDFDALLSAIQQTLAK